MPFELEIQCNPLGILAKAAKPENNEKQWGSNGEYNAKQ
jgi:hypothetical protein